MRLVLSTLVASFALSTSLNVQADHSFTGAGMHHAGLSTWLAEYDSDGNGMISLAEMSAAKTASFNEGDSNSDSFLSWDEFVTLQANQHTKKIEAHYNSIDTDNSGSVTLTEFNATYPRATTTQANNAFSLIAGDDSTLSLAEFTDLMGAVNHKKVWRFVMMDSDADNQLSLDEYTATANTYGFGRGNNRGGGRYY